MLPRPSADASPSTTRAAYIRELEEQNAALQRHLAFLGSELSTAAGREAIVRKQLAEVSGWLCQETGVGVEEVGGLRERMDKALEEAAKERARAQAAEDARNRAEEALRKREDQVLQLSVQLGRAAAHLKDHAHEASTLARMAQAPAPELPSDLTEAKFATMQRIIGDVSSQLSEKTLELQTLQVAVDIWEARHNVWEAACLEHAGGGFRKGVAPASSGNRPNGHPHERGTPATTTSLVEAEQAWRERCELLRRAREQPQSAANQPK